MCDGGGKLPPLSEIHAFCAEKAANQLNKNILYTTVAGFYALEGLQELGIETPAVISPAVLPLTTPIMAARQDTVKKWKVYFREEMQKANPSTRAIALEKITR